MWRALAAYEEAAKKVAAKKSEEQRMKKQFGDGLKGNLKKGFLSGGSKKSAPKKAPKESAPEVIETLRPQAQGKPKAGERQSAITSEVAQAMASSENPMMQALNGGEWINQGLADRIGSNRIGSDRIDGIGSDRIE